MNDSTFGRERNYGSLPLFFTFRYRNRYGSLPIELKSCKMKAVKKMNKICKLIRIITVAPIAALVTVLMLNFMKDGFFVNARHFWTAILTLTVLPLLAYPISLVKQKDERRRFQRSLAILFAVVGYIAGTVCSFVSGGSKGERVLYLTYLLSGIMIALSSFILKRKSSGHACGISGPVTLLTYFLSPLCACGYFLLIPVFEASLKMKRHTLSQLVSGSAIPVVCMLISVLTVK